MKYIYIKFMCCIPTPMSIFLGKRPLKNATGLLEYMKKDEAEATLRKSELLTQPLRQSQKCAVPFFPENDQNVSCWADSVTFALFHNHDVRILVMSALQKALDELRNDLTPQIEVESQSVLAEVVENGKALVTMISHMYDTNSAYEKCPKEGPATRRLFQILEHASLMKQEGEYYQMPAYRNEYFSIEFMKAVAVMANRTITWLEIDSSVAFDIPNKTLVYDIDTLNKICEGAHKEVIFGNITKDIEMHRDADFFPLSIRFESHQKKEGLMEVHERVDILYRMKSAIISHPGHASAVSQCSNVPTNYVHFDGLSGNFVSLMTEKVMVRMFGTKHPKDFYISFETDKENETASLLKTGSIIVYVFEPISRERLIDLLYKACVNCSEDFFNRMIALGELMGHPQHDLEESPLLSLALVGFSIYLKMFENLEEVPDRSIIVQSLNFFHHIFTKTSIHAHQEDTYVLEYIKKLLPEESREEFDAMMDTFATSLREHTESTPTTHRIERLHIIMEGKAFSKHPFDTDLFVQAKTEVFEAIGSMMDDAPQTSEGSVENEEAFSPLKKAPRVSSSEDSVPMTFED